MALANDLDTLRATRPRTFEQWCEVADPEDRETVIEAINDLTLPANSLSTILRKNGIPITRETIVSIRDSQR